MLEVQAGVAGWVVGQVVEEEFVLLSQPGMQQVVLSLYIRASGSSAAVGTWAEVEPEHGTCPPLERPVHELDDLRSNGDGSKC